jgi:adenylate cyclase
MRTGFELSTKLPARLRSILLTGVTSATPSRDAKHIVLANVLAMIAIVLCWLGLPVSVLTAAWKALAVNVSLQVLLAFVLVLNARGKSTLAGMWLYGACLASVTVLTSFQPVARGLHFWLLLLVLAPFVVFPRRVLRAADLAALFALLYYTAYVLFRLGGLTGYTRFGSTYTLVALAAGVFAIGYYQRRVTERAEDEADEERERSERLLREILPAPIVERLKAGEMRIADRVDEVSVLFADVVGFTQLADRMSPQDIVRILDEVFTELDRLSAHHGLEKIKTIGDAYMVAAGVPDGRTDHADAIVRMGLDMIEAVDAISVRIGVPIRIRVGVHSGPVVAGVIGTKKLVFDLWGDAVNTAARMESHGVAGEVHVSESTRSLLTTTFEIEARGQIEVKGKGAMTTFLVRKALALTQASGTP